jgi:hypothetical protein
VNREFVLYHLREASEELARTVREIEKDTEYGSGELLVAVQHVYHHLNSAWNGRDVSELKALNVTDASWSRLGEFPADFPVMRLP